MAWRRLLGLLGRNQLNVTDRVNPRLSAAITSPCSSPTAHTIHTQESALFHRPQPAQSIHHLVSDWAAFSPATTAVAMSQSKG